MRGVKQAGVTLLETMLVLAIGTIVVAMSVRYYKASITQQQAAQAYETTQAVLAALDTLAGTAKNVQYTAANVGAGGSRIAKVVGSANLQAAGYTVTATPFGGYAIIYIGGVDNKACLAMIAKVKAMKRMHSFTNCYGDTLVLYPKPPTGTW